MSKLIENLNYNLRNFPISYLGYENFKNQLAECFAKGILEGYSRILSPDNMNKTIKEMNGKVIVLDENFLVSPKFKGDTLFHIDMMYCDNKKSEEEKINLFIETPIGRKIFFNYIQSDNLEKEMNENSFINYSNMFNIGEFTRFHKYMMEHLEASVGQNILKNIVDYNRDIINKPLVDNSELYENSDYMRYLIADALVKGNGLCSAPVIDLIIDIQEEVMNGQKEILKECFQQIKENFEPETNIDLNDGSILTFNENELIIQRGNIIGGNITLTNNPLTLKSDNMDIATKPIFDNEMQNFALLTSIVKIKVNKAIQEKPANSFQFK